MQHAVRGWENALVARAFAAREHARLREFERQVGRLCAAARILPAITAVNAGSERARLVACVARGELPEPQWAYAPGPSMSSLVRLLDRLRREARDHPAAALHEAKLDELELDLRIVAAVGLASEVRPLAALRYGTGAPAAGDPVPLREWARSVLAVPSAAREAPEVPADGPAPSVGAAARSLARAAGIAIEVRVDPSLAAGAASAERTMFVADRCFGAREAMRLAVHEVLGHLVAVDHARGQRLRIFEWGTAGAFGDQEGVALCLEARHGYLDAGRMRTLAARVLATDAMHAGVSFGETVSLFGREHGFDAQEAIALAERAYRGGGVARDAAYARGYLRVSAALDRGHTTLDELRLGRIGLDALPAIRALHREAWVLAPRRCTDDPSSAALTGRTARVDPGAGPHLWGWCDQSARVRQEGATRWLSVPRGGRHGPPETGQPSASKASAATRSSGAPSSAR